MYPSAEIRTPGLLGMSTAMRAEMVLSTLRSTGKFSFCQISYSDHLSWSVRPWLKSHTWECLWKGSSHVFCRSPGLLNPKLSQEQPPSLEQNSSCLQEQLSCSLIPQALQLEQSSLSLSLDLLSPTPPCQALLFLVHSGNNPVQIRCLTCPSSEEK